LSDFGRAAASIVPVLLFRRLDLLLQALVLIASIRAAIALFYFRAEFRGSFHLDRTAFKRQLAYALPFGLAILVEIVQYSLPQYVVAHLSTPATFAIFAVGCLSIPLVDFAASPTSDVMMVKMQENLAAGRTRAVLGIWHDTTWKLALLFFPLVALVVVAAREIIILLFTAKYAASIPIFIVWSLTILLTTLQVDGVLRVFAQTRLLLALNLMRLAIIAGLIKWSLSAFSLVGPVLVIVLATLTFKAGALIRMKTLLQVRASELLPWRNLAALLAASAGAGAVGFAVKSLISAHTLALLLATAVAHSITYALLVWNFDLLSAHERLVISEWVRRTFGNFARVLEYRKG
jgi:O-antigen/teichoic acid export membrane protein